MSPLPRTANWSSTTGLACVVLNRSSMIPSLVHEVNQAYTSGRGRRRRLAPRRKRKIVDPREPSSFDVSHVDESFASRLRPTASPDSRLTHRFPVRMKFQVDALSNSRVHLVRRIEARWMKTWYERTEAPGREIKYKQLRVLFTRRFRSLTWSEIRSP